MIPGKERLLELLVSEFAEEHDIKTEEDLGVELNGRGFVKPKLKARF